MELNHNEQTETTLQSTCSKRQEMQEITSYNRANGSSNEQEGRYRGVKKTLSLSIIGGLLCSSKSNNMWLRYRHPVVVHPPRDLTCSNSNNDSTHLPSDIKYCNCLPVRVRFPRPVLPSSARHGGNKHRQKIHEEVKDGDIFSQACQGFKPHLSFPLTTRDPL